MSSIDFSLLPNWVATRRCMHGISFNLLVVGQAGIGKTTLINSLFDFDFGDSPDLKRELTNVTLRTREFRPQNKTIDLRITIIETKGLGNQCAKSNSYKPILDYIEEKYENHLRDELKVNETMYNDIFDNRVHCCIYMIPPTGLQRIDLFTMEKLHKRVCLIPVIAKSDTISKEERIKCTEHVRQQIGMNGIEVYNSEKHTLPIAVAASNEVMITDGKRHRVRVYEWGTFDVETHSELAKLRDLVLRGEMLSLVETTNRLHYEKYRAEITRDNEKYETEKIALLKEIEKLEEARNRSPFKRSFIAQQ